MGVPVPRGSWVNIANRRSSTRTGVRVLSQAPHPRLRPAKGQSSNPACNRTHTPSPNANEPLNRQSVRRRRQRASVLSVQFDHEDSAGDRRRLLGSGHLAHRQALDPVHRSLAGTIRKCCKCRASTERPPTGSGGGYSSSFRANGRCDTHGRLRFCSPGLSGDHDSGSHLGSVDHDRVDDGSTTDASADDSACCVD